MSEPKTHYTASITVNKVDLTPDAPKQYGKRETNEVVRITLKANDLEALKAKIAAHVALIEEES